MNDIPWVEKYRPTNINSIILDDYNKKFINNIIKIKTYPNLLLYGPPGTGKTTTIINLIKEIHGEEINKSLILHLNASDERGIDTIRKQIHKIISSKPLFSNSFKFVVLDEVDYMTKSAQIALKYVLQQYTTNNVIFYLMCNYISKIDETLKNEFIELKFNILPNGLIINFLKTLAPVRLRLLNSHGLVWWVANPVLSLRYFLLHNGPPETELERQIPIGTLSLSNLGQGTPGVVS